MHSLSTSALYTTFITAEAESCLLLMYVNYYSR